MPDFISFLDYFFEIANILLLASNLRSLSTGSLKLGSFRGRNRLALVSRKFGGRACALSAEYYVLSHSLSILLSYIFIGCHAGTLHANESLCTNRPLRCLTSRNFLSGSSCAPWSSECGLYYLL